MEEVGVRWTGLKSGYANSGLLAGSSREPKSVRLRKIAAISAIAGSLITRRAWIAAGRASALDAKVTLESRETLANS